MTLNARFVHALSLVQHEIDYAPPYGADRATWEWLKDQLEKAPQAIARGDGEDAWLFLHEMVGGPDVRR